MPPPGRSRRGSGTTASSPRASVVSKVRRYPVFMLLVATDPRFAEHDPGRRHPERPQRLEAVLAGLERVHTAAYLDQIERVCAAGGGALDPDTSASPGSWEAAIHAAGAGLEAVAALERGDGDAAFCAVRPPGHHALASRAMGFCLVNNV